MDLDNSSMNEECAMIWMDTHYEDGDKDIILYGDQGDIWQINENGM